MRCWLHVKKAVQVECCLGPVRIHSTICFFSQKEWVISKYEQKRSFLGFLGLVSPHVIYKLCTRVKIESQNARQGEPSDEAGSWKRFSTMDHVLTVTESTNCRYALRLSS